MLMLDIRYAVRALARTPSFTLVATLTIALGIGIVTTMASVAKAVLWQPLPFDGPEELVEVRKLTAAGQRMWISIPELGAWRQESRGFSALAGSTALDFNLMGVPPAPIAATGVTRGYLELLGARLHIGRGFTDGDYEPGAPPAVLLSFTFWQQRFAADPAVVGRTLDLAGPSYLSGSSGRYTVAGVLAPGFWHFYDPGRTHIVIPLRASATQMGDPQFRMVERIVGRVGGGTPQETAAALLARSAPFEPPAAKPATPTVTLVPLAEAHFGGMRRSMGLLVGAAFLVALIAAVNVALLFLVRTHDRRGEVMVRTGLGASRAALVRLQAVESTVVVTAGALLGTAVAASGSGAIRQLVPASVLTIVPAGAEAIAVDRTVLAVVAFATAVVAVCAALAPAWAVWRVDTARAFVPGRGMERRSGIGVHRLLAGAQAALAVTLLAGAGLLVNSVVRLSAVPIGVTPPGGIVTWINLNPSQYPDPASRARFYDRVLDRLRATRGVAHATAIDLPFNLDWQTVRFATRTPAGAGAGSVALDRAVSVAYFERHGIPLRRGRSFTARDDASSAAVAVVSDTLAQRAWPGRDPVGQRLVIGEDGAQVDLEVVGVAGDVRSAPQEPPQPMVYRPYAQHAPPWLYVTVEGEGDAEALVAVARTAVAEIDPQQAVDGPWTYGEWIEYETRQARLLATLAGVFSGLALLLAGVGLAGVLTHVVMRRTKEFGIRLAVGATPLRVLRTASVEGLRIASAGIVVGTAGALALSRTLEGLLFGIQPADPLTHTAVALLFALVAWVATMIPALRAARVDPATVLRAP